MLLDEPISLLKNTVNVTENLLKLLKEIGLDMTKIVSILVNIADDAKITGKTKSQIGKKNTYILR